MGALAGLLACSDGDTTQVSEALEPATEEPAPAAPEAERFVLASITIDADGNRVSYAQIIDRLTGDFDNSNAIEAPGNAVFLTRGSDFFYGLAESPTWVRYSTDGGFRETGQLSFLNYASRRWTSPT